MGVRYSRRCDLLADFCDPAAGRPSVRECSRVCARTDPSLAAKHRPSEDKDPPRGPPSNRSCQGVGPGFPCRSPPRRSRVEAMTWRHAFPWSYSEACVDRPRDPSRWWCTRSVSLRPFRQGMQFTRACGRRGKAQALRPPRTAAAALGSAAHLRRAAAACPGRCGSGCRATRPSGRTARSTRSTASSGL
jgi:hypothetical protein